jgi:radical SAM superfamily enzyme YgiQ (UPF0313 family)
MRIKLVEPSRYGAGGRVLRPRRPLMPSLSLPTVAALTPADIDVSIEIDALDGVRFDEPADLVGLTAHTLQARRAYDIAREFRARGVPVVMGGVHASMEPEEALKHVDTVIAGEAEDTWPRFLRDFQAGRAAHLYRAESQPSLSGLPVPRFDLLPAKRYVGLGSPRFRGPVPRPIYPVQTARGCPHACDYCTVMAFSGRAFRARPTAEVVAEIRAIGARGCMLVDDNIFSAPARARELFEALIPLKLWWIGQATIGAGRDPDLLRLARRSGCAALCLGIESLSEETLHAVGKDFNRVREYGALLRAFHDAGISAISSFVFGLDGDDESVFPRTYNFLVQNHVPYTLWNLLLPLPGTALHRRLAGAGRLKAPRWWMDPENVRLRHERLTFTGLRADERVFCGAFRRFERKCYSMPGILRRILFPGQDRLAGRLAVNLVLGRRLRRAEGLLEG